MAPNKTLQVSLLAGVLITGMCLPAQASKDAEALMKLPPDTPVYSAEEMANLALDPDWRSAMDRAKAEMKSGKFNDSEADFEAAVKIARKKSPNSIMLVLALNGLGAVRGQLRKWPEAETAYKEADALCAGGKYPAQVTNMVKGNLGDVYTRQGKSAAAQPLIEKSGQFSLQKDGKDSALYATSLDNKAVLLKRQGHPKESEAMHKEALKIWEKVSGAQSADYAVCLTDLAVLYSEQKQYAESESCFKRVLAIYEKICSDSDLRLAETYLNLGIVSARQGKTTEADAYFKKDIAVRKKIAGTNEIATTDEMIGIGREFIQAQKYAVAISYFEQALAIKKKALGANNLDVADCMFNIAVCRIKMNEYGKAEELLKQAKQICEKNKPCPLMVAVFNAYAEVLSRTNRRPMAIEMAKKAQEIRKSLSR